MLAFTSWAKPSQKVTVSCSSQRMMRKRFGCAPRAPGTCVELKRRCCRHLHHCIPRHLSAQAAGVSCGRRARWPAHLLTLCSALGTTASLCWRMSAWPTLCTSLQCVAPSASGWRLTLATFATRRALQLSSWARWAFVMFHVLADHSREPQIVAGSRLRRAFGDTMEFVRTPLHLAKDLSACAIL